VAQKADSLFCRARFYFGAVLGCFFHIEAAKPKAPKPENSGNDLVGESQESETQLPETTWHNATRWEQNPSGKCQIEGACLSSPHFPKPYGHRESCEVSLPPFSVIRIVNFTTEHKYDYLTINGYKYSGSGESVVGATGVLWSNISWQSYHGASHGGWRICAEKPPSCSDGLELVPVAIPDCPPSGEDLPNCNDAAPGELCEGDGRCGTRKDLNNCYDKFHTYPATRDVYQKDTGSTRTSTTSATTMTMTTTLGIESEVDRVVALLCTFPIIVVVVILCVCICHVSSKSVQEAEEDEAEAEAAPAAA